MSDSASALNVGTVIASTYEVVRLLGRGGMGEVWLARHLRLPGKQVAIKVLRTGGQLPAEVLARFKREAEVATRIGHPNIVEVHDFNALATGEPYLVLEFLQGESLASRLLQGQPSLPEVSSIIKQVGAALAASHAIGVVHRDLKPDNIFLVPSQLGTVVKVLDFGISKIRDSSTVQTQDSALLGTPQYMAPEQALGDNKEVGPWTDVWALGSIAYEMLAGRPPFSAESVARVVFKVAYEPHTPLAELRADIPPRMVQAVEGALLKKRDQRLGDVETFVSVFTGQPVTSPQGPAPVRAQTGTASGIAAPGSATDEAAAFASTVAPTPQPVSAGWGKPSDSAGAASGAPGSGTPQWGSVGQSAQSGAPQSGAPQSGAPQSAAAQSAAAQSSAGGAPKPDRRSSAVGLAGAGLGVALVGASIFLFTRLGTPSNAQRAADAGTAAVTVDAGDPVQALVVLPAIDAGLEEPPDAGATAVAVVAAPDAGPTRPTKPIAPRVLKLTDAERTQLDELEAAVAGQRWDRAKEISARVRRNLAGNLAAQGRASVLELHALCATQARGDLQRAYNQLLTEVGGQSAQAVEARKICKGLGIRLEDIH